MRLGARRLADRFEGSIYFGTDECGKFVMSSLFFAIGGADLRLLFRKPYYMVVPYLLSLLDAGIALQGLITQVIRSSQNIASPRFM